MLVKIEIEIRADTLVIRSFFLRDLLMLQGSSFGLFPQSFR
jgi:hypothetical protein